VGPGCRRERGGVGLGRLGAGWAGWSPGVGPVGLLASSFIFFFFFPFLFCSKILFGVLKEFFYSDLNKI
jgi:hypothetical protein